METESLFYQYWWPAFFAFVLTLVLVLVGLRVFPRLGLLDRPKKYGLLREPIPYYGGVLIYIAFIAVVLVFVPMTRQLMGLFVGASLIMVVGFLDDMFDLSPWVRLFFQLLACVVLVWFGVGILSMNLPFLGNIDFTGIEWNGFYVLSGLFTVVWVVTILNTMNFVDGVSGLSSGVTFIAAMTMFLLSIHPGVHENPESQVGVAIIALVLAMCALAFFVFDLPRPKILMGDTGSTFFGFVLAALAIFSGGKVATAFLVLGIPILDMVWVVLRRTFSGQKFWKGDMKHLHHRLLDLGLRKRRVVSLYLFVTAIFGVSAIMFVSSQQKFFVIIAMTLLMALLAGALVFVPRKG